MNLKEILYGGLFLVGSYCVANMSSFNIDSAINLDSKHSSRLDYIENTKNKRTPILNHELSVSKIILPRVEPNPEPNVVVEEFFGDKFRRSRVIKELPSGPSLAYWEDTKYFLNGELICIWRKAHLLSKNKEDLEGVLDANTIITKSGKKYVLENDNGVFSYRIIN